jgi:hypothetical protein
MNKDQAGFGSLAAGFYAWVSPFSSVRASGYRLCQAVEPAQALPKVRRFSVSDASAHRFRDGACLDRGDRGIVEIGGCEKSFHRQPVISGF